MWRKFTIAFWKKIFSWLGYKESDRICECGQKIFVKTEPEKKYTIKNLYEVELETCLNPDCQHYTMIGTVLKFKS